MQHRIAAAKIAETVSTTRCTPPMGVNKKMASLHKPMLMAVLVLSGVAESVRAGQVEQVIGGIDAVILACGPIDPKSAKTAVEMLERERVQRKLDLAVVRSTDDYKTVYNTEVNRLLGLTPKARIQACQTVW